MSPPGPTSSRRSRTMRMIGTGSVATVAQGLSFASTLVITPLLVRRLGALEYGIFVTIVSLVGWMGVAQLGLGPVLLNKLSSEAGLSSRRESAVSISSAIAIQTLVSALVVAAVLVAPSAWLSDLVNSPVSVAESASRAVRLVVLIVASGFPFSFAGVVFEAQQRGYVAHSWQLFAVLLRTLAVVGTAAAGASFTVLLGAFVLPQLVAFAAQSIHAFVRRYPSLRPRLNLVEMTRLRQLLGVGKDFVVIAVAGQVIVATDFIVLAQVAGPAAVTPYAVASQLTQLPTLVILVALRAAWPAYSEAATADIPWLLDTHRRVRRYSLAISIGAGLLALTSGQLIIRIWAGEEAVPTSAVLWWLVTVSAIQAVLLPAGRLLTALGETRINAKAGIINAAINLPTSLFLGHEFGAPGVAAGTVVGYVCVSWILMHASRRLASLSSP